MAFNVLTPRLIVPHLTLLSGPFCTISLSPARSLYPRRRVHSIFPESPPFSLFLSAALSPSDARFYFYSRTHGFLCPVNYPRFVRVNHRRDFSNAEPNLPRGDGGGRGTGGYTPERDQSRQQSHFVF